ncbi:MAG: hypothetical protein ACFB0D_16860 [Phormidesmis sp.]
MTDGELRALVAQNASTIDRIEAITERNASAIDRIEAETSRQLTVMDRLEKKSEYLDRQLALLAEQVRSLTESQTINDNRLTSGERLMRGVYDILQTNAREQAERSALIDQQIQSLIDERRRS